jgi:hypothetical protein
MSDGWLTMDSAPLDMTQVIGMDLKGAIYRMWFFAPSSRTRNWLRWPGNVRWKPVCWMPLPDERKRSSQSITPDTTTTSTDVVEAPEGARKGPAN